MVDVFWWILRKIPEQLLLNIFTFIVNTCSINSKYNRIRSGGRSADSGVVFQKQPPEVSMKEVFGKI